MPSNYFKNIFFAIVYISFLSNFAHAEKKSSPITNTTVAAQTSSITEESSSQTRAIEEQRKFYHVELILFEQKNDAGIQSELWTVPQELNIDPELETGVVPEEQPFTVSSIENSAINNRINANPKAMLTKARHSAPLRSGQRLASYDISSQKFISGDNDFTKLSAENYQLMDEYQRIRRSSRYNVLSHIAWIQPGLSKKEAKSIGFYMSKNKYQKELEGNIEIVLSRYLHANIDLVSSREVCHKNPAHIALATNEKVEDGANEKAYDASKESATTANQAVAISIDTTVETKIPAFLCSEQMVVFKQSRKMRSRELHYIDNPGFGILILIIPVEQPETVLDNQEPQPLNQEAQPKQQEPQPLNQKPQTKSTGQQSKALDSSSDSIGIKSAIAIKSAIN